MNTRRLQIGALLGGAAMVTAALATNPAAASNIQNTFSSIVHCTKSTACIWGDNKGNGAGVEATNEGFGNGLYAQTANNDAVSAQTTNPSATQRGRSGVYGFDGSKDGGTQNCGVCGSSSFGIGSGGTSDSGRAGQFIENQPNSRALWVYATANGADGTDINGGYIGVVTRAPVPGSGVLYPFVATDSNGNDLNFTDTNGDFYYHGSLIQFLRTRQGQKAVSYAPQMTTRTIEDVGSAQLRFGIAIVKLDNTFAQAIDTRSEYHVFLTPNGDTRGLYVTQKSPASFVVREAQGGRGSLTFDYRIVASPLGHAGDRMGMSPLPTEPKAPPRAPIAMPGK